MFSATSLTDARSAAGSAVRGRVPLIGLQLGRVVNDLKKYLEKPVIGNDFRVEADKHRLGMAGPAAADLVVICRFCRAAGIT